MAAVTAIYLGALHTRRDAGDLFAIVGVLLEAPSAVGPVAGWLDREAGPVRFVCRLGHGWCAVNGPADIRELIDGRAPQLITTAGDVLSALPTSRGPVRLHNDLVYEARPESEGWSLWSLPSAPATAPVAERR
ncbi:hypothetical protein AB0M43_24010 [Longispora sp. NPDC051575]|uniref:hypothetical protein n=1 Tax=Longispora sp. NPDC051575 TaxID=3154943 RepID=UPI00343E7709